MGLDGGTQIESETFTISAIGYDSCGILYLRWNSGRWYWWSIA